jgi:hypothetical protein
MACAIAPPVCAQPSRPFELAAQVTFVRPSGVDGADVGIGARLAWNVNAFVAVEGVSDVFPAGSGDVVRGGRKLHAVVGPRVGWHGRRAGVFAKGRIGIARVGEGAAVGVCILIFPPPEGCYRGESRLAFELGGGIEVYPTPRTLLRVDVADFVTRLTTSSYRFARPRGAAHDLKFGAGFGLRF